MTSVIFSTAWNALSERVLIINSFLFCLSNMNNLRIHNSVVGDTFAKFWKIKSP